MLCRGELPKFALAAEDLLANQVVMISRLEEQWNSRLTPDIAAKMLSYDRMTVLNGDILLPNMGIAPQEQVYALHQMVEIVIHAASSINLGSRLSKISSSILGGSERAAKFGLGCQRLERFAFVSTAYVNAYLSYEPDAANPADTTIEESFYPLTCAKDEWVAVQKHVSSPALEAHNFPWPYAYAKHLSERLVTEAFDDHGASEKLLILRPSIIGPAQNFPFPGYSIPLSTPSTLIGAGIALTQSLFATVSTQASKSETEATADEVPVDVAVDRLLVHLAKGTTGPVHAVSGNKARMDFMVYWKSYMAFRRVPWPIRPA